MKEGEIELENGRTGRSLGDKWETLPDELRELLPNYSPDAGRTSKFSQIRSKFHSRWEKNFVLPGCTCASLQGYGSIEGLRKIQFRLEFRGHVCNVPFPKGAIW